MSDEEDDRPTLTGRERIARHRQRERERALQIAVAAARLALGRDPGDQRRALAEFLRKAGSRPDVPEDYLRLLEDAADCLLSRRRR